MGPIGCPETSLRNYHYSQRNNPEKRSSNLLRGGSLQWRKIKALVHVMKVRRAGHYMELSDQLQAPAAMLLAGRTSVPNE